MESDHPAATPHVAASTEAFLAAFDTWSDAPGAAFPFAETVAVYHAAGKHFVPQEVTGRLWRLRESDASKPSLLHAFLDTALDKLEGRYDYASYCALSLLSLPEGALSECDPDTFDLRRDRALLGLLGDLTDFELGVLEGRTAILPLMRPSPALSRKRLTLVLAALRPSLQRLGCPVDAADPVVRAQALLDVRGEHLSDADRERLSLSVLPVHRVHDEYLFLRTLQAFEVNFAWIGVLLRRAIVRLESDPSAALACVQQANRLLREAARLFPLIASMQIAAFHEFRRFTEGASAIQSTGYKSVEAICRRPDDDRLDSAAFDAVPAVRRAARDGQRTLEEAVANAPPCADILSEVRIFEEQLLRWRQAHFQIARRFLGDLGGTGYTEGVPYLARTRTLPLFRNLPEA